jgi:hypothetical protein
LVYLDGSPPWDAVEGPVQTVTRGNTLKQAKHGLDTYRELVRTALKGACFAQPGEPNGITLS